MSYAAGKVAAVTGASSGIGLAIAEALAERGAAVLGLARRFDKNEAEPVPGAVVNAQLDVRTESAVADAFARHDIDILICAAGTARFGAATEVSLASLEELHQTHVAGTVSCCNQAVPGMIKRGRGHVIVIGSVSALQTIPNCAAYAMAKAAQRAFTLALAAEVRPAGVCVTHVAAGAVDTPLWNSNAEVHRSEMMTATGLAQVVVGLLGTPAEEIVIRPPKGIL